MVLIIISSNYNTNFNYSVFSGKKKSPHFRKCAQFCFNSRNMLRFLIKYTRLHLPFCFKHRSGLLIIIQKN